MHVYFRIKPGGPVAYGDSCYLNASDETVLRYSKGPTRLASSEERRWLTAGARHIFQQDSSQDDVWDCFRSDLLESYIRDGGGGLTVFVGGHTHSGKSHLLDGSLTAERCQRVGIDANEVATESGSGLVQRTLAALGDEPMDIAFLEVAHNPSEPVKGMVWDLLANKPRLGLKFVETAARDGQHLHTVPDGCWHHCTTTQMALTLYVRGKLAANEADRRGHTILAISTGGPGQPPPNGGRGRRHHVLTFVELAGSRYSSTAATDTFAKQSTSALERVLKAASEKPRGSFINFHANKLTQVLQDFLMRPNRWAFFLTLTTVDHEDSLYTVDFGVRLNLFRKVTYAVGESSLEDKAVQAGEDDLLSYEKVYATLNGVCKLLLFKKCDTFYVLQRKVTAKFGRELILTFTDTQGRFVDVDDDETLQYVLKCNTGGALQLTCREHHKDEIREQQLESLQNFCQELGETVAALCNICETASNPYELLHTSESIDLSSGVSWEDLRQRINTVAPAGPSGTAFTAATVAITLEQCTAVLAGQLRVLTRHLLLGAALDGPSPSGVAAVCKAHAVEPSEVLANFSLDRQPRLAQEIFAMLAGKRLVPLPELLSTFFQFTSPPDFANAISLFAAAHQPPAKIVDIVRCLPLSGADIVEIARHKFYHDHQTIPLTQLLSLTESVPRPALQSVLQYFMNSYNIQFGEILGLCERTDRGQVLAGLQGLVKQFSVHVAELFPNLPSAHNFSSVDSVVDLVAAGTHITGPQFLVSFLRTVENTDCLSISRALEAAFVLGAIAVLQRARLFDIKTECGPGLLAARAVYKAIEILDKSSFAFGQAHGATMGDATLEIAEVLPLLRRCRLRVPTEVAQVVATAVGCAEVPLGENELLFAPAVADDLVRLLMSEKSTQPNHIEYILRAISSSCHRESGEVRGTDVLNAITLQLHTSLLDINVRFWDLFRSLPKPSEAPLHAASKPELFRVLRSSVFTYGLQLTDLLNFVLPPNKIKEQSEPDDRATPGLGLLASQLGALPIDHTTALEIVLELISRHEIRCTEVYNPANVEKWAELFTSAELGRRPRGQELLLSALGQVHNDSARFAKKCLDALGVSLPDMLRPWAESLEVQALEPQVTNLLQAIPLTHPSAMQLVKHLTNTYRMRPTEVFPDTAALKIIQAFAKEGRLPAQEVLPLLRITRVPELVKVIRYFVVQHNLVGTGAEQDSLTLMDVVKPLAVECGPEQARELCLTLSEELHLNLVEAGSEPAPALTETSSQEITTAAIPPLLSELRESEVEISVSTIDAPAEPVRPRPRLVHSASEGGLKVAAPLQRRYSEPPSPAVPLGEASFDTTEETEEPDFVPPAQVPVIRGQRGGKGATASSHRNEPQKLGLQQRTRFATRPSIKLDTSQASAMELAGQLLMDDEAERGNLAGSYSVGKRRVARGNAAKQQSGWR